jgi:membrane-bound lytic murein transglycosylase B
MKRKASFLAACLAFVAFANASALAAPAPPEAAPEDREVFSRFLRDFRAEAMSSGIGAQTYDRAIGGIRLNPRVQELNLKQPEFVRPVWEYLKGAVSQDRVRLGREAIAANAALMDRLKSRYGVQGEVLGAIWGLETAYGRTIGSYNIFEALATLAYQGPRAAYGKKQLLAALKIAQEEKRDPKTMVSSWAGAFGETQFVPTTFLEYAVDDDGDGKRDLWGSQGDALASAANYLKASGWEAGTGWGEQVLLPPEFPLAEADPEIRKPLSQWQALGVRKADGGMIDGGDVSAAIFIPAGYRGPAFLLRQNFNVVLKYNFATSYALAIGLLSDRLGGAEPIKAQWPEDIEPLDESGRVALQDGLTMLGFDTGGADGVFGRRTRNALREYQKARGLPADGFPTPQILTRILNEGNPAR